MKIGFIKKSLLKLLTRLQELTIGSDGNLYFFITNLHFRLYYGLTLQKAVMSNNLSELDAFGLAADRHGNMVVCSIFQDSIDKERFKKMAIESFTKNYLLDIKL